jgi:hypothetical protein
VAEWRDVEGRRGRRKEEERFAKMKELDTSVGLDYKL